MITRRDIAVAFITLSATVGVGAAVQAPSALPAILSGLKSLLETGHALALQMAPPQRMLDGLKRLGVAMPDARLPTSE